MPFNFKRVILTEKFSTPSEILEYGGKRVYAYNDEFGERHRNGGKPAEIHSDGRMFYYKHGELVWGENLEKFEEQIEEVMENFNFERVHSVMKYLKWSWHIEGVPSIEMIKNEAKRLLIEVYNSCHKYGENQWSIATGGFQVVYKVNKGFSLEFVIESWDTFP